MLPEDAVRTFELLEPNGSDRILISAEHAGKLIPPCMNSLGLPQSEIDRHIGWDIGVAGVARCLHNLRGLPTILGRYSRLVTDLNRPTNSPECVIEISDGTRVPGNCDLTAEARSDRIKTYHKPFHDAFHDFISQYQPRSLLSLHSFTPQLRLNGKPRPWHCGILYGDSAELAQRCLAFLRDIDGLVVGENEPYRIENTGDYTIPVHGDGRRIPVVLVEIRQDLICADDGQEQWAEILARLTDECFPPYSSHNSQQ